MNHEDAQDEYAALLQLKKTQRVFELLRDCTGTEFQIQSQLRREFPAYLVRMALTLDDLRRKAEVKFSRAADMWFDRKGLQQATPELVALHKANRFQGDVFDLCTGIGADAIAFADHCRVLAVDIKASACLCAQWNAEVYGVANNMKTVCGDVKHVLGNDALVHIDPDRRFQDRGRVIRIEEYEPGLDFLNELISRHKGGAIKLSPASNFGGKFQEVEIELVSLDGECKEATVWFGELAGESPFRATVLPANQTLAGDPLAAAAEIGRPGEYLYNPDPAIVRAGLVDLLCEQLQLRRVDAEEEYLTGSLQVVSPFVRGFQVLTELPNNEREIRRFFRQTPFGEVEIKCRHIPIRADSLRRKLSLKGKRSAVLIFSRVSGRSRAFVCRRID